MDVWVFVAIALIAVVLQYLDAAAGMGFGEITALLLIAGFHPLEVVPAVILTSAVLSAFAGFLHVRARNLNITNKRTMHILSVLIGFGIIAIICGAAVAVRMPEQWLTAYIGIMVMVLGVLMLMKWEKKLAFKWKRLIGFAIFASFNKGMTGGGYGPVLASGQILAGVKSKEAVGMTAIAESVVSTIAFAAFVVFFDVPFNGTLVSALLLGGFIGSPIAVHSVRIIEPKYLRLLVAIASLALGVFILGRLVWHVF